MPAFNRFGLSRTRTWAFFAFNSHHTELNELYWSFVPVAGHSDFVARNSNPDTPPATVFSASGPDVHRLSPTIDEWRIHFTELSNWVRLSFIVAALGYLEVYLKSVAELSFRSDPCLLYGKPKAVDGTSWLKLGIMPNLANTIEPLVKGEWSGRIAAYRRLFLKVPNELESNCGRLDALRRLRNGASHAFGRSTDYTFIGVPAMGEKIERVSERSLKRSLKLIEDVAISIDEHLGPTHIGEFESLSFYHAWNAMPKAKSPLYGNEEAMFRKALAQEIKHSHGADFCAGLIDFYKQQ